MKKKTINVQGLAITIEQVKEDDYISLTDIAKQSSEEPRFVIQNWMKNSSTINYLWEWELLHNPNLNRVQLHTVLEMTASNRFVMSPKKWIETTGAIGLVSKAGRSGGTLAHKDIAINFCYWLSPKFQIYLIKEFQRLKEEEFSKKSLEWHISRITNLVDETRNWLDTIPGQDPDRNRLNFLREKGDE
ncbi:MAG: KilA-N domain-containing protein [Saprospiraceae bacterium]|nr:KilA-N domain-containing protein [Saprospiraceae bacterium]MCF8250517.1 KilA-N domain-containing protein [Saprospiraceae bacterium]MCF8279657.1 KilA-N domain-containing protein [Bacteroidales bacterium]MCF8312443.1 KilA-N domain-containing protein [Saprospiraceae bacterium]MCF8440740.1 KilA-N domain-containing protein [Saprospiraceae bacterium]